MWYGNNKTWTQFISGISASDEATAHFLWRYTRYLIVNRAQLAAMEVIDLQKYKIIKHPRKVRQAFNDRLHIPFVFLSCKN